VFGLFKGMKVVHTILAALIAISVVALPAAEGSDISTKPAQISMSGHAGVPCCPCCDTRRDYKSPTSCAIKCISVFGAILPASVSLPQISDAVPLFSLIDTLREYVRRPPTHPPPV
jgi:hypothetical protein